ncbi:MAG TPA: ABC transporter substrate-binding protein [Nocardioides sp.]|uniref:ABC transporter substrate-binding protein n=1 Tax=Nocardioides sp. TaxID=35761 RepID=UPI002BC7F634|nr:ABC transporter substrate-binding protein [Nocardioides sp.]HQR26316.1 ABC transporter substrate-binding protein [Nocardioides sp.]
MRYLKNRGVRVGAVASIAVLALAACGGGSVSEAEQANESKAAAAGGECGEFNIIVNPWVGYTADAYVVGNVAAEQLGCTVNYVDLKEGGPSYAALGSGDGDVILEEWSHQAELQQAESDGSAVDLGSPGNVGIIGWYVPGWLAEEHPDVLDYQNLNKYASDFKTSESGDQGQFLGSDPTYTQYDEAIIKNLGLDFKVVFSGGETATVEAFEKAQKNKEWLIGYFWEPQWVHAEVPLERVKLPPYTPGCDQDKAKVACDYAETELKKVGRTEFMDSGSTAATLVKNFNWTNDDQNLVAKYITADKMSPEDAAAKWVSENQDKVDAWLAG